MCGPHVAKVVRKRIKQEGPPQVSRRGFLKMGGVMAAAAAVGSTAQMTQAAPRAQSMGGDVVDLSHLLSVDFPVFPAFSKATKQTLVSVEEDGFYAQEWTFGEHTSTHLDAPGHFVADAPLVSDLDPSMLVGPGVVIDIAEKASDNPDAMLDVVDIEAWEADNGTLPEGAFVMMYSGWAERLLDQGEEAFSGVDADGGLHFPGFSPAAAEFLVNERSIKGVGVDTLSIDVGTSSTFDVHYTVLGAGLVGIENLNNLAALLDRDTPPTVVLGVPKYSEGSGGPLRALALG